MSGRATKRRRNQKGGRKAVDVDEEVVDLTASAAAADALGGGEADGDGVRPRGEKRPRHDTSCSSSSSSSLLNGHPHSRLPSYLSEAFSDLYSQDGLVAMGRGLGWLGLLCSFVMFYGDPESHGCHDEDKGVSEDKKPSAASEGGGGQKARKKPPLVFVLNLREDERRILISTLSSWGTPTDRLPQIINTDSGQGEDRSTLYARGGVFVVTSRILIVDLLSRVVNARDIEGMLVAHAETVIGDGSTEAFILRIFRSQRYFMDNSSNASAGGSGSGGFIKAFTDDATSLVSGFAKVDKVLKSLQVQRLYLYPRFHASVAEELERHPPNVIELHQPLSESMRKIQDCLAAAMRACLRDLRSKCHQVDLSFLFDDDDSKRKRKRDATSSVDEYGLKKRVRGSKGDGTGGWKFTIQRCITTNFFYVLKRQLEGDWHGLSRDAKQAINDLRHLRQMFIYLIENDCVEFWRMLLSLKAASAASKTPSGWMLQGAGEDLFRHAKARVYRLDGKGPGAKLRQVLEARPKETLLRQVLTEVENRWKAKVAKSRDGKEDDNTRVASSASVLLMVKDERTLRSITSFLRDGGKRAVSQNFLRYLDQVQDKFAAVVGPKGLKLEDLPTEQRLLYEEHGKVRKELFGPEAMAEQDLAREADRKRLTEWKRKHRRIVEEKARGVEAADAVRQQARLEEAVEESRGGVSHMDAMFQRIDAGCGSDEDSVGSCSSEDEDELAYKVEPIDGLSLFIRTFSKVGEGDALLLQDIRPDYVVMYDSDPSFIRTLEIYSNSMKLHSARGSSTAPSEEDRLQVFFLLYEASFEDVNFLKTLEREKESFDKLIDHKRRMPSVLPSFSNFSTQEMQQSRGGAGGSYAGGTLPLSMDTRTGGGRRKATDERRDVAVDVREFRSALPSILHQGGMRLAPVTLIVGDFVLSNVHCVERKSLPDLIGSIHGGRLRTQVEAMVKHYKVPCLLIEFDPEKTFRLVNPNDLGGEIRNDTLTSKLTLLTMHFPRLRLLWSRSPHETLKIFKKLKRNHPEVDVAKAVEIGKNDESLELEGLLLDGGNGYDDEDFEDRGADGASDAARKLLLHLPGVTPHNARKIMGECDSIAELAGMSREELRRIAGPIAGQKLFTFFRQRSDA